MAPRAATPTRSATPPRSATPAPIPVQEPLDVDLDELLEDDRPSERTVMSAVIPTPPGLELLAADVEETVTEYEQTATASEETAATYEETSTAHEEMAAEHVPIASESNGGDATVDVGEATEAEPVVAIVDVGEASEAEPVVAIAEPPAAADTRREPPEEDLGVEGEAFVSYSEPAIAPGSVRATTTDPLTSMRVPAIPDFDLHVAAALESVAQRIRAGDLSLPQIDVGEDDASSLALALAALLASRR